MSTHNIHLDLDEFKPEVKKADPIAKDSIEKIAEMSGFKTRHAPDFSRRETAAMAEKTKSETLLERESAARRRGRKRTTNRNIPFSVKLKIETNNQIYELADRLGCNAIAEVLELALAALEKELSEGEDPRIRAVK